MSSAVMTAAALGQPFTLGMLYDARRDMLIPGFTLWDQTTLQNNTRETSHCSSNFQISASDSIESKSNLLDVNASLKASFLGGLIEVGGSAKYLNDQKKYHNRSRVTFQYKATTKFKQLSMTQRVTLNKQRSDIIDANFATHVVTGILYGANAFFVFDSEKLDASSVQDIQGHMEAVIKKIPSFNIEGKVDIKLTDEEKAVTDKFSCKFYGDLLLESNPATFVDAVKTYVELPKRLGVNGENAAPLKVWMMSLKDFNVKAADLMNEISVGLVRKAEGAFEDIRQIEMRCNDSLEDSVSDKFPEIGKMVTSFQKLCKDYKSSLQQTMKEKFPAIREGKEDESSLAKQFEDKNKSPFSQEKLSMWMDHKQREINVIKSCVDVMEGTKTKIVKDQSELDREVLAPGVEDALCFVFTSLESADPCIDAMEKYFSFNSIELGSSIEEPWFLSNVLITKMREKAKVFHDLAKALKDSSICFLMTAIANEKHKGATIYHYNEGILATDDFSRPDVPEVNTITDKKALIWYACDLSLDPNTANYNLILSDDNKKATRGARQEYPDLPERFDSCTQVLCREGLTGRCYWEVEFSAGYNEDMAVGVAYKQIPRKEDFTCYLGRNDKSWCLCLASDSTELYVGHDPLWSPIPVPSTDLKRVGVYLDWLAGTLSFYHVSGNSLSLLYCFRDQFTQPVFPGCYIYRESGSVSFCPVE